MKALLLSCVLVVAGIAQADDAPKLKTDRDRAVKAALALAAASDPEKCECAKARVLDWGAASEKGLKEMRPVVVFSAGTEPRCCGGAIPATIGKLPTGFKPDRPIVVYAPLADGTGWKLVAELPADAPKEAIKAAVKKATPKP